MKQFILAFAASAGVTLALGAHADELQFPQIVRSRYEAMDQKQGGQFILWSEREKIHYGLDPKLYPAAQYVDVTQVTPTIGSITLTYIEIKTTTAHIPDYLYLAGNVRFRLSGMVLKLSNFPAGNGMVPPRP